MSLGRDRLVELLHQMWRIRYFEREVIRVYQRGLVRASTHTYVGEEAIAVGACAALRSDDWITSTHRGHGHIIARGAELEPMMAEILGRANGTCKGKGGSMHIADLELGILGANGIVGGSLGIAAGAAFTSQLLGDGRVTLAFFGDGGLHQGIFHESASLAGLWKLPVIFLCENNRFAEFTRAEIVLPIPFAQLHERARAYGLEGVSVDGNDVFAVHDAVAAARERAASGEGATLIVAHSYRLEGHNIGDPETYRTKEEVAEARANDPIPRFAARLIEEGVLDEDEAARIEQEERKRAAEAVQYAMSSPEPELQELLSDVYV